MHCQFVAAAQDPQVVEKEQEAEEQEAEEQELEQSAEVDYPLQANRLRLNFRQSRRMLS